MPIKPKLYIDQSVIFFFEICLHFDQLFHIVRVITIALGKHNNYQQK
jgi:hypothetical protein